MSNFILNKNIEVKNRNRDHILNPKTTKSKDNNMISMYRWYQVKEMLSSGFKLKKISRDLKISRNTVRKYARSKEPPQFKTPLKIKNINGFEEKINEMYSRNYIGTRIFEELMKIGFKGSINSIYRYLKNFKLEERKNKLTTTRFETLPGEQMQYDWKEWNLPISGQSIKIYIHEVILSYSRKKFFTVSLGIKCEDIKRAIESSFKFFGGKAKTLVIDNPKQMIITHHKDGVIHYNEDFLKFCGLYGVCLFPCQNYRARTKGKVERPFYYLQEHLLRGLEVNNLIEFENKLETFMNSYNLRIHSKLQESPDVRFKDEVNLLKPFIKIEPTLIYNKISRKVSNDGFISYNGKLYPVPMKLCLEDVWIMNIFNKELEIYNNENTYICNIQLNSKSDKSLPVHPEHEKMNDNYMESRQNKKLTILHKFKLIFSKSGEVFFQGLKIEVGENAYRHIKDIMNFCHIYKTTDVVDVLKECILLSGFHKDVVKQLLEKKKIKEPEIINLNPALIPTGNITRDLSDYKYLTN